MKIWTVVVKIRTRKLLQLLKIYLRTLNTQSLTFVFIPRAINHFISPPKKNIVLMKRKGRCSVEITFFKNVSCTYSIKYT